PPARTLALGARHRPAAGPAPEGGCLQGHTLQGPAPPAERDRTSLPQGGLRRRLMRSAHPDDSWFWPVLGAYRDPEGRTLEEAARHWVQEPGLFASKHQRQNALRTRRWRRAPRSEKGVEHIVQLVQTVFDLSAPFTYLEFGIGFGTTLARILGVFERA